MNTDSQTVPEKSSCDASGTMNPEEETMSEHLHRRPWWERDQRETDMDIPIAHPTADGQTWRSIKDRVPPEWVARDLAAANARLAAVEALHKMNGDGMCVACDWSWPCPTLDALRAPVAADPADTGR